MPGTSHSTVTTRRRPRTSLVWWSLGIAALPAAAVAVILILWTLPIFGSKALLTPYLQSTRGLTYLHDSVPAVPWSMHVIKISRTADLSIETTLGSGDQFGMATISDQVRRFQPPSLRPIAAINGDLYTSDPNYPGDPEGLQIKGGELVSGPSTNRVCFWIDSQGSPHIADVRSRFMLQLPDGCSLPFGLNQSRLDDGVVLYTPAVGASTRTQAGIEIVLEPTNSTPSTLLPVGTTLVARIRSLEDHGNTPLHRGTMVVSFGPKSTNHLQRVKAGDLIELCTETTPQLRRVQTAIGGGPTLVSGGKAMDWPGLRLRHPRTAIGWNEKYYFLVEVDGRQLGLSAGMTLPELADYMVKLGCKEAMNLDGGGSATCWLYGNVMNSPSQGHERPSANAIVIVKSVGRPR